MSADSGSVGATETASLEDFLLSLSDLACLTVVVSIFWSGLERGRQTNNPYIIIIIMYVHVLICEKHHNV